MRLILTGILVVFAVCAQAPEPDRVVATVDGQTITVSALREMLAGAAPAAIQNANANPTDFLRWHFLLRKLTAEAEELGLQDKPPYSYRLAWARGQVLMMAKIEQIRSAITVSDEEARRYYEERTDAFGSARVKLLFLAADESNDQQVKAKAEALAKQARSGADFAKLARQHSDDQDSAAKGGDFDEVGPTSKLPVEVKRAIFATEAGGLTEPVHQPGGYYLFQVVTKTVKPLSEVREEIRNTLMEQAAKARLDEIRDRIEFKLENEELFGKLERAGPFAGEAVSNQEQFPPDAVLVSLNGRKFTVADYTGLLQAAGSNVRDNILFSLRKFLEQYAFVQELVALAEKAGLDTKQPYQSRILHDRVQILMQARVDAYLNAITILPEEQKSAYEATRDRFRFARAKVLYVSFSLTPPPRTDPSAPKILTEPEAREHAEAILAQVRSGAEFVGMVRRFSEDPETKAADGEMPLIMADDAKVPEEVRRAVLASEPGGVVGPMRMPNGFYLFRVEELGTLSYEQVKDRLYEEMQQARFQEWIGSRRFAIRVEIADEAAFRQALPR